MDLLQCNGRSDFRRFVEICCAVALVEELSNETAIAEGHFRAAHHAHGKKQ